MSLNLMDLVKGQLTEAVVGKAASFLGESPEATKTGLGAAVPSLITGLLSQSGSPQGASGIMGMLAKPEVLGALGNVSGLMGGDSNLMEKGSSMLTSLLGDKVGGIVEMVSSVAGFKKPDSAKGLLSMAAPLVMGTVAKQVGGSGVNGLMDLLGGQVDFLKKDAPPGLMDKLTGALGIGSLGALAGGLGNVTGKVGDMASTVSGAASAVTESVSSAAGDVTEEAKKGGSKLLPILGVLALLAAAFFGYKSCNKDKGGNHETEIENTVGAIGDAANDLKNNVGDVAGDVKDGVTGAVDGVKDGINDVTGDMKDAVNGAKYDVAVVIDDVQALYAPTSDMIGKTVKGSEFLGVFNNRKLNDGTEIIVMSNGFESQLIDFIESGKAVSKGPDAWFNLRRVLFATGSANLEAKSNSQIDNVVKILKAYPNVSLKLGGYTDNTGNAAKNKALSDKRAKSVMAAMVAKGIDASRLAAEGYGIAFPCATNDTAEGRALNRRVSARVSKK